MLCLHHHHHDDYSNTLDDECHENDDDVNDKMMMWQEITLFIIKSNIILNKLSDNYGFFSSGGTFSITLERLTGRLLA